MNIAPRTLARSLARSLDTTVPQLYKHHLTSPYRPVHHLYFFWVFVVSPLSLSLRSDRACVYMVYIYKLGYLPLSPPFGRSCEARLPICLCKYESPPERVRTIGLRRMDDVQQARTPPPEDGAPLSTAFSRFRPIHTSSSIASRPLACLKHAYRRTHPESWPSVATLSRGRCPCPE